MKLESLLNNHNKTKLKTSYLNTKNNLYYSDTKLNKLCLKLHNLNE